LARAFGAFPPLSSWPVPTALPSRQRGSGGSRLPCLRNRIFDRIFDERLSYQAWNQSLPEMVGNINVHLHPLGKAHRSGPLPITWTNVRFRRRTSFWSASA